MKTNAANICKILLTLTIFAALAGAQETGDAFKAEKAEKAQKAFAEEKTKPAKPAEKTAATEDEEKKTDEKNPISDNSFLIEEAYNQEPGVMQTITTCAWFRKPQSDVGCTVTQEFPVVSQKHQFGYTMPFSFLDSNRTQGVGDFAFNYRYQLTGEKSWAVVAPRVSLLLPTGSYRRGLGTGATGVQFNLPVSKRVSKDFVTHFNAGATFLGKARGNDLSGAEVRRNLTAFNLGGSLIWVARKRTNFIFEYLENFSSEIDENGRVRRFNEHIVNPGVRFAVDLGPLQIVPGIGVPTSFADGRSRTGVFFYLSFEHPFKKLPK